MYHGLLIFLLEIFLFSLHVFTVYCTVSVSFFENCERKLLVRSGETYQVTFNGSYFGAYQTFCRLEIRGTDESKSSGLVDCQAIGSTVTDHGIELILATVGPEMARTYNSSHWIKTDEEFTPAKQYLIAVRKGQGKMITGLNLTLHVSQYENDNSILSGVLGYIITTIFLACLLLYAARICQNRNRRWKDAIYDVLLGFRTCICSIDCWDTSRRRGSSSEINTANQRGEQNLQTSGHLSLDVSQLSSDHEQSHITSTDDPPSYESCITIQPPDVIANSSSDVIEFPPHIDLDFQRTVYNISSITHSDLSGETDDGLPSYDQCLAPPSYDESMTSTPRDRTNEESE